MDAYEDRAPNQALFAKFAESSNAMAQSGKPSATFWVLSTNQGVGTTSITLPQAGNLWINYEWSNAPAVQIGVWHQGGGPSTPILPGDNNIAVGENDILYYQLSSPASDPIKLTYQIT